jgi:hypothetical protein
MAESISTQILADYEADSSKALQEPASSQPSRQLSDVWVFKSNYSQVSGPTLVFSRTGVTYVASFTSQATIPEINKRRLLPV